MYDRNRSARLFLKSLVVVVASLFLLSCETLPTRKTTATVVYDIPENGLGPLKDRIYGGGTNALIVLLHGDVSRGGPAGYMYDFAQSISRRHSDTTVVALLRPGYYDSDGLKSPGNNHTRIDQYTSKNNDLVADTIANLEKATNIKNVIVLGHSGGAAQLGVILGQRPELVDAAILLSCPCDLASWRTSNGRKLFTRIQSPSDFVKTVAASTQVAAITGAKDDNTRPYLAENYIRKLKSRGLNAVVKIIPEAGHHRLGPLTPAIFETLSEILNRV
jgi:predicted esterase